MKKKILDAENPVFREKRASSKIETVIEALEELRKKRNETGVTEKAVIVSQWTSMLLIIKNHVKNLGFKVSEINGQVPVKLRGGIGIPLVYSFLVFCVILFSLQSKILIAKMEVLKSCF